MIAYRPRSSPDDRLSPHKLGTGPAQKRLCHSCGRDERLRVRIHFGSPGRFMTVVFESSRRGRSLPDDSNSSCSRSKVRTQVRMLIAADRIHGSRPPRRTFARSFRDRPGATATCLPFDRTPVSMKVRPESSDGPTSAIGAQSSNRNNCRVFRFPSDVCSKRPPETPSRPMSETNAAWLLTYNQPDDVQGRSQFRMRDGDSSELKIFTRHLVLAFNVDRPRLSTPAIVFGSSPSESRHAQIRG